MKRPFLILFYAVALLLCFTNCSSDENIEDVAVSVITKVSNEGHEIIGDGYAYCDIAYIPTKDFPTDIDKQKVYEIFRDKPKYVTYVSKSFVQAVPEGDYTILVQVGTAAPYTSLTGAFTYKRISAFKETPNLDFVVEFEVGKGNDYHPWKDEN